MNARKAFTLIAMAVAALLATGAGCPAVAREPLVLPTVGGTFAAPYDAVWDATLKGLGVVRLLVADKAAGRIETEPYAFVFTAGIDPARQREPVRLASREPAGILLANEAVQPTQVVWVSMRIAVRAAGENRTDVLVDPLIHDSLLPGYMPGPYNSPWGDLFARMHSLLGGR